jgi:hypothetical protein
MGIIKTIILKDVLKGCETWSPTLCDKCTLSMFENMVLYIKRGTQAKGILKQDPEANIWAQEGCEWKSEKGSTMRNFIVCTVHLI